MTQAADMDMSPRTLHNLHSSPHSTITIVGIQELPNEILLATFIHVARIDPRALTQIAQPWTDPRGCETTTDWKTKFRIHAGWVTRQAQNYVVWPCRPETISSALRLHPILESEQEDHQHYHHLHHHHHPLPDGAREEICASSSSRSTTWISPPSYSSNLLPVVSLGSNDALSCSLCTYSDLCVIPHTSDGICVRTHRHADGPRMQVLDRTLQSCVAVDDVHGHQDLVSGMAVNDEGSILVSSSIDATVRVWLVQEPFRSREGSGTATGKAAGGMGFMEKVHRFGCPIRSSRVLQGHVGWVNAVAIQKTTIVSGGSDHTVRIWDALSGECIRVIPDLYTSRDLGLGVYTVALQGGVVGSGTVIEGYQLHDVATGQLLLDLDEPLSSREHFRFESADFQHYASRMVMTETVVVTNSKLRGLLCVWDRASGKLLYRIRACPPPTKTTLRSNGERTKGTKICSRSNKQKMVTHNSDEMMRIQLMQPTLNSQAIGNAVMEGAVLDEVETVHTFKLSSSGSMLMCTMCDGRLSLFEFGESSQPMKVLRLPNRQVAGQHQCGYSVWIWSKENQSQRLVLV